MRITIGGVLVVLCVAAVATVFFLPTGMAPEQVGEAITSIREKINTSLGLFHSASSASQTVKSPLTADSPISAPVVDQSSVPVVSEPPPTVIPTTPVVAEEKPVVKKKGRSRRHKKTKSVAKSVPKKTRSVAKTAAPAVPVAAKAAVPAPKAAGGSLIGEYVVLTLNTGREVKGILREQDAVSYKVELPGLGEFTYPAQNVKSIRASN